MRARYAPLLILALTGLSPSPTLADSFSWDGWQVPAHAVVTRIDELQRLQAGADAPLVTGNGPLAPVLDMATAKKLEQQAYRRMREAVAKADLLRGQVLPGLAPEAWRQAVEKYLSDQLAIANLELASSLEFQRRALLRADAVVQRDRTGAGLPATRPAGSPGSARPTASEGLLGN